MIPIHFILNSNQYITKKVLVNWFSRRCTEITDFRIHTFIVVSECEMFSTVSRAGAASTKTVRFTPAKVIFVCVLVRFAVVSCFRSLFVYVLPSVVDLLLAITYCSQGALKYIKK